MANDVHLGQCPHEHKIDALAIGLAKINTTIEERIPEDLTVRLDRLEQAKESTKARSGRAESALFAGVASAVVGSIMLIINHFKGHT